MNRFVFAAIFAVGLLGVAWVGYGFVGTSALALAVTLLIACVYLLGALELRRFRADTASLAAALADVVQAPADVHAWLQRLPAVLRNPVRMRVEGERSALPGLALTPYLVGLLVMLGMLGTFLGMVVTFKGAVFALEGSTDLQAIRSALAAPIKGLGLSFGTSVAGVAASAVLGLLSAMARRERLDAVRLLDARIATSLRPFSMAHQRQEAFHALQVQAHALPDVAQRLQAMMDGMEQRSQQLNAQLLGQQAQFHQEVSGAYGALASSVGASLQASLAAAARAAGDSIQPVVQAAMAEMAQESTRLHQRVFDATQTQLNGLALGWDAAASRVSDGWAAAQNNQERGSEAQAARLDAALQGFADTFAQRSSALLASVQASATQSRDAQRTLDQQHLHGWTQALQSATTQLQGEWRSLGAQALAQQQAVCQTLEKTAGEMVDHTRQQAGATLAQVAGLVGRSEALLATHTEAETRWTQQQAVRLDALAQLWREELGALRADEAVRGQAAVDRLAQLQSAVATHLGTLGAALEAPLERLMATAAQAPQAAAEVIAQLRQQMAGFSERDNQAVEERTQLVAQLTALLHTLNQASGAQRAAIDAMVASASGVLDHAAQAFAQSLGAQASQTAEVAAQVAGSAVELASLGESFGHGVQLFSASNEKLATSLQRVEAAIQQSAARSDEQLAYYVAQAREVIDLSISAQQTVVADMRRLRSAAAVAEGAAA